MPTIQSREAVAVLRTILDRIEAEGFYNPVVWDMRHLGELIEAALNSREPNQQPAIGSKGPTCPSCGVGGIRRVSRLPGESEYACACGQRWNGEDCDA